MTISDADFRKFQFQRCLDKPLDPTDPAYEPLYDAERLEDPVRAMQVRIGLSEVESLQYFSGFKGSGKTTELRRLADRLTGDGFRVFHASAGDYLDLASPLFITDLLLVLAAAFSDALEERGFDDIKKKPFHRRLMDFIKRVGVDIPALLNMPAELFGEKLGSLKLTLRNEPDFRDKLRKLLENRLSEFKSTVDKFFEDGLKAIRGKNDPDRRVVFLFDQLEQLRGSLSNHVEVVNSVQSLFRTHADKLRIPHLHVVCTVPPWLRVVLPGIETVMLTSIRLWYNKPKRPIRDKGWDQMRRILVRRFPDGGMDRFFGQPDADGRYPLADQLIAASSGVLRDLLRLVRNAISASDALPVDQRIIDHAIQGLRNDCRIEFEDDALWLHSVGMRSQVALKTNTPEALERFTRYVDAHAVLIFSNGEHWYDLHTLVREDVARIARSVARRKKAEKKDSDS